MALVRNFPAYQGLSRTRTSTSGIPAIGDTITPFGGSASYSAEGEAARIKVNEWVRSSGVFDSAVNFDKVARNPVRPTQLLDIADSGCRIHPSDAGYAMMSEEDIGATWLNDRFWRKAAIGLTGAEWPLLTQSGHP
jgi:hypothetical protein